MKIFLKVLFLLTIYSCGYQPLLVQKSDIIFFNETTIIGETKISKAILKNLNNFKGENSDANLDNQGRVLVMVDARQR